MLVCLRTIFTMGGRIMKYIVERDLFMSKLRSFINEKAEEGYELVEVFVSEEDIKRGADWESCRASKVTVIMKKDE